MDSRFSDSESFFGKLFGINENDDVMAIYEKLSSFFKQIGHKSDFDRLYEEAKRLANVVRKIVVADKTYKIARKLSEYGPYKYLKTSVKQMLLSSM